MKMKTVKWNKETEVVGDTGVGGAKTVTDVPPCNNVH